MTRLLILGDVHGHWNSVLDEKALRFLKPDIVLFVGDFGNEDYELVEEISKLDMPKAVILGNHDCWWDGIANQEKKYTLLNPYRVPETVARQLTVLGDTHMGYKRMDFPDLKLSVVGVRPFSLGGNDIFNAPLIKHLYGVTNMKESAEKITELALNAPEGHALIFLGHNGPTGLGTRPEDLCGNDFEPNAEKAGKGDHGDPDLADALRACRIEGKHEIPLVVFGHMHHNLCLRGKRNMLVSGKNNTVYVNTAVVPRAVHKLRNFTVVDLGDNNQISRVAETWVAVDGNEVKLAREKVVYST